MYIAKGKPNYPGTSPLFYMSISIFTIVKLSKSLETGSHHVFLRLTKCSRHTSGHSVLEINVKYNWATSQFKVQYFLRLKGSYFFSVLKF